MEDEVHAGNVIIRSRDAHHAGKVSAHVEIRICSDVGVTHVLDAIDVGTDRSKFGHQVGAILIHVFPAGHLVEFTGCIVAGKYRVALHGKNCRGEHGHRMGIARQCTQYVNDVLGNLRAFLPVFDHFQCLLHGRYVSGHQHPPEAFNIRIITSGYFRQSFEGFGNGFAAEADAFIGVEVGDIGDQALDASGAADGLTDGHVTQFDIAAFLDQTGDAGAVLVDFLTQGFLQC